jgi:cytoskeletal protein CcmA (bactofilin family)
MSQGTDSKSGSKRTLVEEGTELRGTLTSSCPVVVMGKVEGELNAPTVEVTETGVVSGRVVAAEVRARGELAGSVEADSVNLSGRVRDQTVIRAKSLEVKLTREDGKLEVSFGACELQVGDPPSKQTAVDQSRAGADAGVVAEAASNDASGARAGKRRAAHEASGPA